MYGHMVCHSVGLVVLAGTSATPLPRSGPKIRPVLSFTCLGTSMVDTWPGTLSEPTGMNFSKGKSLRIRAINCNCHTSC